MLREQGAYKESLDVVNEALRTSALIDADLVPLWIENSWTLAVSGHYDQAIDVLLAGLASIGTREDALVGRLLLELSVSETFDRSTRWQRSSTVSALGGSGGARRRCRACEGDACGRWCLTTSRIGDEEEAETLRKRGVELAQHVGSVEELGGC